MTRVFNANPSDSCREIAFISLLLRIFFTRFYIFFLVPLIRDVQKTKKADSHEPNTFQLWILKLKRRVWEFAPPHRTNSFDDQLFTHSFVVPQPIVAYISLHIYRCINSGERKKLKIHTGRTETKRAYRSKMENMR